jgi:gamma-D-glutamyl-L-lysine dipeptidyl-peptidase
MLDMPAATVVIVPATTLWVDPTSPRGLDAPAVATHPDVLAWLAGLDAHEGGRIGLHGRVGSQLVLGEPVEVVGAEGDWRQVVCPWQPSSADPHGYPGWVPAAHLGQATSDPADAADAGVVAPTPHGQVSGEALVAQARLHLGLAYLWGGMSPYGLDCSGLVHLSLRSLGLLVPRDAHDQQDASTPVEVDAVRPGEMLFFARNGQPAHHVGIATGEGRMLHAPETGAVIVEEPLTPERLQTLSGAGRFTTEADDR